MTEQEIIDNQRALDLEETEAEINAPTLNIYNSTPFLL